MSIRGDQERYGLLARIFHWFAVVLFLGLAAGGTFMTSLDYYDPLRPQITMVHRTLGLTLFAVMALRLLWVFWDVRPRPEVRLQSWEKVLSRSVHVSFYVLLLTLPILGFLFSGGQGGPIQMLAFTLPSVAKFSRGTAEWLIFFHQWFTYLGLTLAALHFGAVLKHHFIDHIALWRRML